MATSGKIVEVSSRLEKEWAPDVTVFERETVPPIREGLYYTVEWKDGSSQSGCGIGILPDDFPPPAIGDRITVLGDWGQEIRGIVINDRILFARTEEEMKAKHEVWLATYRREQAQRFERERAAMDLRYESLQPALRARIDRFRAEDPKFRQEGEGYEMAAVYDANLLSIWATRFPDQFAALLKAKHARVRLPEFEKTASYDLEPNMGTEDWEPTPSNLIWALDLLNSKLVEPPYRYADEQEIGKRMGEIAGTDGLADGHSGNTWGHAVVFALAVVQGRPV